MGRGKNGDLKSAIAIDPEGRGGFTRCMEQLAQAGKLH